MSAQSDVDRITTLMLRHPKAALGDLARIDSQWRELNYREAPDFDRAVAQYERFVDEILDLAPGIEITFLPDRPGLTLDSLYVRDAAVACERGLILCNMGKPARAAEPGALADACAAADIPILGEITGDGRLEGGDVAWLDPATLAVGHGYRTNAQGIRQLEALLKPLGVTVIEVPLPHHRGPDDVFHLMSILSPLDADLAAVYSPLVPVPFRQQLLARGIRLVEIPDEEFDSLGCNVLAAAPRRCILIDGNPITRQRLEAAGCEVRAIDGSEICVKGGGGPTCLTRPIRRTRSP